MGFNFYGARILYTIVLFFVFQGVFGQTVFRGVVKDSKTKNPIPQVKIQVEGQGIGVFTNSTGFFNYKKYTETVQDDNTLVLTAPNYKQITIDSESLRNLMNGRSTFLMDPVAEDVNQDVSQYNKVAIFWDVSNGMRTRNVTHEIDFLNKFSQDFNVSTFEFTAFDNQITNHLNPNKNLNAITDYMSRDVQEYNGFSNYDLAQSNDSNAIILFSNGDPFVGELKMPLNVPIYVVTSGGVEGKGSYLRDLIVFTGGSYRHLDGQLELQSTPLQVNNTISDSKRILSGTVTSNSTKLEGASILLGNSFDEYLTDANGNFEIPVNDETFITVSYFGMYSKKVVFNEKENNLSIDLLPNSDMLDEVVLTGNKKEEKLVVGGRKLSGYDGRMSATGDAYLTAKDFPENATTLEDLLKNNHFTELRYRYGSDGYIFSTAGGITPIFVDGVIAPDVPVVYARDIASIILKTNPLRTNRYGPYLKGSAIIVTTNSGISGPAKDPLIKGNDYTENIAPIAEANYTDRPIKKGVVKGPQGLISGATIIRKGSLDEYTSKSDGSFSAPLKEGDIIQVSYLGMYPKLMLVEDKPLSVELIPQNELLDEVVVEGSSIITAYGREKKDKIGYAASTLTSEQIRPTAINIGDVIRGQFAGVQVYGFGESARFVIRSGSATLGGGGDPIWVVDNNIFTEVPNFIPVQDIETITILKSSIAAVKYGSLAIDGAFVITTKTANLYKQQADLKGSALVKGNTYGETVKTIDQQAVPDYIKKLQAVPNLNERFALYNELAQKERGNIEFYVDAVQYFAQYDTKMASQILENVVIQGQNSKKVLRTAAYLYESIGDFDQAQAIYKRVLSLYPQEAQSYRDLALIYQETGAYNEALSMYINMLGEQIKGVSFDGLEKHLRNELSHLVALHKDKIDYERLPNVWLRSDFKIDLRMVLEWSDQSVPFEFQFVNPNKKFFKWAHTLEDQRERLLAEQQQGYQTEEFIIDDAVPGEWIVNVQYLGNITDSAIPPFLKYVVYKDYGTPEETKEIKVIKLFRQTEKVSLGKLVM